MRTSIYIKSLFIFLVLFIFVFVGCVSSAEPDSEISTGIQAVTNEFKSILIGSKYEFVEHTEDANLDIPFTIEFISERTGIISAEGETFFFEWEASYSDGLNLLIDNPELDEDVVEVNGTMTRTELAQWNASVTVSRNYLVFNFEWGNWIFKKTGGI